MVQKIAFVVNSYPPRMGGLEQHLSNLAQGLSDLGVEVTVFTIGNSTESRFDGKVRVLTGRRHLPVADVISFPTLGTTNRLAKVLKDGGFDAVSVHTRFFPMSFVGVRAAKKAGIPVIHTEHGSGFVANDSAVIALASRIVDQTLGRYVFRSADQVLGVSDEAATFTTKLGAREPRTFFNAIPVIDHEDHVTDRPEHMVFVGRMVGGKGWDLFIQAVHELRQLGYEVDGEMLGDGESLQYARTLVRELDLADVVHVRGRVDASEVRKSLSGATLVNPTVLSEGFQTTLLETIAESGRVVTFAVPGAHLLQDQGAPVVITDRSDLNALTSSIRTMLDQTPEIAPEGIIENWTWPRRSAEYLQIVEDVISRTQG